MTQEVNNVTGGAQPVIKKNRRGVSNKTQAVNQIPFHESEACKANGLFVAQLYSVSVDWSTNADGKMFTGMKLPRLTLHFTSRHDDVNKARHVYQTLFPQESNVMTIPGGPEEWKVNNVLNWIKHVLDVFYLKGRNLTEAEEDALTLPFEDYKEDENGALEYVAVDPQEVVNGYQVIFENAAAMLNGTFNGGDGKPCYKAADGKCLPCWIKLLRYQKRKNEWKAVGQNGALSFSAFPGTGAIELVKKDQAPEILRVDFSRESITPKETAKVPSIGTPSIPGSNIVVGGIPNVGMGNSTNAAFADAGDEMPF